MVLRLLAHIITGILLTGLAVWLIAQITDAAWKSVQRRRLTREAAERLLGSWSQLADAQREAIATEHPAGKRRPDHLSIVRPPKEK